MTALSIVGIAGSLCGDPKLTHAVNRLTRAAGEEADAIVEVVDYCAIDAAVRSARFRTELDKDTRQALSLVEEADALVIGVPFERGSIPGAFKHLFDLSDPGALAAKPVVLVARDPGPEADAFRRHLAVFLDGLRVVPIGAPLLVERDAVSRGGALDTGVAAEIRTMARRLRLELVERIAPAGWSPVHPGGLPGIV